MTSSNYLFEDFNTFNSDQSSNLNPINIAIKFPSLMLRLSNIWWIFLCSLVNRNFLVSSVVGKKTKPDKILINSENNIAANCLKNRYITSQDCSGHSCCKLIAGNILLRPETWMLAKCLWKFVTTKNQNKNSIRNDLSRNGFGTRNSTARHGLDRIQWEACSCR